MRRFLVIVIVTCAIGAQAQPPFVPEDRIDRSIELRGDRIMFCLGTDSPVTEFDRAVATEIAATLLLDAEFYEVPPDFPLYEEHDFLYALYILLVDHCNAFIGFNLAPEAYPEWLTFTRPYAHIPYVLAVTNEAYDRLGDIPRELALGVPMLSQADVRLITYLQSLPANERWRRLPYADRSLMLTRLREGDIAGAFFWSPVLAELIDGDPQASAVRTIPTDPVTQAEASLGIALLAQDTYLRTTLDQAIMALIEEGILADLMDRYGLAGQPGRLER